MSVGYFSLRRRTVSMVSSTLRVVWESQMSFSVSTGTSSASTESGPSTRVTTSGASPAVPSTSSCPSWPTRRIW